jgi:uncharacterized protein (TIGR03435 family)
MALHIRQEPALLRIAFLVLTACILSEFGNAQGTQAPIVFDSATVKPTAADAPMEGLAFMIGLGQQLPPQGLLRMTGPLPPFIIFAYGVQDEVEARAMRAKLPEWAQKQKFTVIARPPDASPTQEQLRLMMRSLLEERFALKAHRETHTGTVNLLQVVKSGMTGPGLKQHDAAQTCVHRVSNGAQTGPEPGKTASVVCGLELHQTADGLFHVSMVDVTLPEACTLLGGLAGVLGGRGMDIVTDATGLTGKWDITLDFLPEREGPGNSSQSSADLSGPGFIAALEKQLGLRLKKGAGQIEDLIIDHIAQPTPD